MTSRVLLTVGKVGSSGLAPSQRSDPGTRSRQSTATMPVLLGAAHVANTTDYELLAWAALALVVARIGRTGDCRWWLAGAWSRASVWLTTDTGLAASAEQSLTGGVCISCDPLIR